MKRLTLEQFIDKSRLIHGNKYDYSLVNYTNNYTKIKIICNKHGVFEMFPSNHLSGRNCKKCSIDNTKLGIDNFIKLANKTHNNKYDYSLVEYINNSTKIKIICKNCKNTFEQKPNNHIINKSGCSICSHKNGGLKNTLSKESFIKKANIIHNNKYDYSLIEYTNRKTKVKIICEEHGIFEQKPTNHINNQHGCPKCKSSKGEKTIRQWLIDNKIQFEEQKKFKNCRGKRRMLPFDFCIYIDNKIYLIEYDGKQHFGIGRFASKYLEINDRIKDDFAKQNNIDLIRIPYYVNDINEELAKTINWLLI